MTAPTRVECLAAASALDGVALLLEHEDSAQECARLADQWRAQAAAILPPRAVEASLEDVARLEARRAYPGRDPLAGRDRAAFVEGAAWLFAHLGTAEALLDQLAATVDAMGDDLTHLERVGATSYVAALRRTMTT